MFRLTCSERGTPPCFVVGGVGTTGELPAPELSQCPAQILPSSPLLPDPGSWKAEAQVPAPATLLPTHPLQCTHTVQLELPELRNKAESWEGEVRGGAVRDQTVVASQGRTVVRVPGRWPGLPFTFWVPTAVCHLPPFTPTPPLPCVQPPCLLQPWTGAPLCTVFQVDRALRFWRRVKGIWH